MKKHKPTKLCLRCEKNVHFIESIGQIERYFEGKKVVYEEKVIKCSKCNNIIEIPESTLQKILKREQNHKKLMTIYTTKEELDEFYRVKCPKCGNCAINASDACHTYTNGNGGWKSCIGCFSAIMYHCLDDECDWHYIHGLNPKNPRANENEENRPNWLFDDLQTDSAGMLVKHKDVPWV